jgi:hypothetical protein
MNLLSKRKILTNENHWEWATNQIPGESIILVRKYFTHARKRTFYTKTQG